GIYSRGGRTIPASCLPRVAAAREWACLRPDQGRRSLLCASNGECAGLFGLACGVPAAAATARGGSIRAVRADMRRRGAAGVVELRGVHEDGGFHDPAPGI